MKRNEIIRKIVMIAMFSAISYVTTLVVKAMHLSFVPGVGFLEYDPKDIIICIGGFILGPISAVIVSAIVSLIEMFTISTTGFYGLVMNIISTCAFVVPAALIYRTKKNFLGALLSLLLGFVSAVVVMGLWNIIITPIYMGIPRELLVKKYLGLIILFNILKVGINISLVLMLYKPIITALRSTRLIKKSDKESSLKTTITMIGIGVFLLLVLIVVIILLKHFL